MFNEAVRETALTTATADGAFSNITGEYWNEDSTFLATLRALLINRIPDEDQVMLRFRQTGYSMHDINDNSKQAVFNAIVSSASVKRTEVSGEVYVHSLTNTYEANVKCMEITDECIREVPGWVRLPKVTEFFHKAFRVDCYINKERRNVYLLVDSMDYRKLHYMQCAIFAFMPWYFDPEEGVTEIEMELINSLREKEKSHYLKVLQKIAEPLDLREKGIRNMMAGFESREERIEMYRIERKIRDLMDDVNTMNSQIMSRMREKAELDTRLLGLKMKVDEADENDSELMNYFLCNKNLTPKEIEGSVLTFVCRGYAEYFDEELAERVITNENSYLYEYGRLNQENQERREKVLRAIFLDRKLKLRLCAAYRLHLESGIEAYSGYRFGHEEADYLPNPHIQHYRCMGNYVPTINKMIRDGNYVGVIDQCMASCQSLNFGDSTVMEKFAENLFVERNQHNQFIELPDGTLVNMKTALEWVEEQEAKENE